MGWGWGGLIRFDLLQPPILSSCAVVNTKVCTALQQSQAVTQQSEQNCSHYAKHLCIIQISTCRLYKLVQNCSHYAKYCTLCKSVQNCSHYVRHCTLYKSVQNCSHYGKHCTLYRSVQNCSHYAKHCTLYKSVQNCSHHGKDLYSIQISAELQQIYAPSHKGQDTNIAKPVKQP